MKTLHKLLIGSLLAFLGLSNNVFASATPIIDYTTSPFNWVQMLSYYGPDFTTFKESPELWASAIGYGPFLISSDKTDINTVTMWFRMTATSSISYTCPDLSNHGYTIPYQLYEKFSDITLVKMSASSTSYNDIFGVMGMDQYGNSAVAQASFIDIYNFGTSWTQNSNGSCSTALNSDNSTSTISAGWYFLYFTSSSISSHTLTDYTTWTDIDISDPYKVSVLGDNSFDTSLMVEKMGTNFYFTSNHFGQQWFPFKPSFPTIDFSFLAPPVVTEVTSCNPFSTDITHAFLNTNFTFSTCLSDVGMWLIKPTTESLQQFTDLKTSIENKPPFGYFTMLSNNLNNLSTTSSATTTLDTITIPTPLQTYIFTPLRNGLIALIWFVGLVFLFNRLKHIQL
jgi:hypothetical protein